RFNVGAAVRCLAAAVATAAVVVVPFLVFAPAGLRDMVDYQRGRPLQMESLGATLAMLQHKLQTLDVHLEVSFGSMGLFGPGEAHLDTLTTTVAAIVVACLIVLSLWVRDPVALATMWCAIVVAAIALGRVLSPQYMLWIVPLVPFVPGRIGRLAVALT